MLNGMRLRADHTGHTPGMTMTMDMAADVEALRAAPEPFDVAFIDAMIPHHQDAVDAAQVVLRREIRPEIRRLVTAIAETQTREIAQLRRWRTAWVAGSPGTGTPAEPRPGLKDEHAEAH